ncbi:NAD-dependent dehydratase [Natronococcus pandeyae]|uniref:NAD-dependent dehydratase n=1 Tax=Natronococcus pandeyae TaxID=2055836 RepID=A0A8J8PY06_9EURY|nr:NAD-dependent epimerase/dehydratase family protein [Natronococcus pandeyae]TYL36545.1 NAD-dependent dehydratase [Natronococcus pandeyae]
MITNKQILITGGAGFIGSHLAEQLTKHNYVTVLDNFSTGSGSNIDSIPVNAVIDGSVTDRDLVERVVANHDIVVHMAAVMGVRRTLERPLEVLEVNVDGTRTVLDAASNSGVERVLVASTSEVYGDAPDPPYGEDDEQAPKTNYAVAKLADERFTQAYQAASDLDYTIVRYFNVYGPRQDSSGYGYVVPIFVRNALADESLRVHGDGDQTRDFTYIDDAIDCTISALSPAGRNEVFNVGSGSELAIRDLAECVVKEVGDGKVEYVEHPRPYTVKRRCSDISKAKTLLGYTPRTSLSRGIEKMTDSAGRPQPRRYEA